MQQAVQRIRRALFPFCIYVVVGFSAFFLASVNVKTSCYISRSNKPAEQDDVASPRRWHGAVGDLDAMKQPPPVGDEEEEPSGRRSGGGGGRSLWFANRARALEAERDEAARIFREKGGYLWFMHIQKAAGVTVCRLLESVLHDPIPGLKELPTQACLLTHRQWNPWILPYARFCRPNCTDDYMREQWKLNATTEVPSNLIRLHVKGLQYMIKGIHPEKTIVASEKVFIPRPVLRKWILEGDANTSSLFRNWSFLVNMRHPADRLYSAFYFHYEKFQGCKGLSFDACLDKPILTGGTMRNGAVKQLAGWFAPSDMGRFDGQQVNNETPIVEATPEDLELAKLVMHRFLPVVIVDTYPQFKKTLRDATDMLLGGGGAALDPNVSHNFNVRRARAPPMTFMAHHRAKELNALDMELYQYALNLTSTK